MTIECDVIKSISLSQNILHAGDPFAAILLAKDHSSGDENASR